MTDRELLELAAKAAGKTHYGEYSPNGGLKTTGGWWNPLTDDGDALRLAVSLGLTVAQMSANRMVQVFVLMPVQVAFEPYGEDPNASTRRAIVRAAAEIGKGMK